MKLFKNVFCKSSSNNLLKVSFFVRVVLTFSICLIIIFPRAIGQKTEKSITAIGDALEKEGFQNITIRKLEENHVITYENNVYRFDALALKKVIQLTIDTDIDSLEKITFITTRNQVPMISTEVNVSDYRAYKNGYSDIKAFANKIYISQDIASYKKGQSILQKKRPSSYRVELVLRPFFTVELGNRVKKDQFIHLIDLRPKFNFYLWKGAHFTYEFILPISNEFKEAAPQWGEIRPRIISLNQEIRLPKNTFFNASIGLFSRDRYGGTIAIGKYFWKGRILTTAKLGYTGHASYVRFDGLFNEINKGWLYTDLDYLDYAFSIRTWWPSKNIQLALTYGKVLNNRKQIRVDIRQKFKEVDLGFFSYKTNEGFNYGMQIGVPLFPKKYWKPKRFSIRPSKSFTYEYLSGNILARSYQAQGIDEDFPQNLHPDFLKFQLLGGIYSSPFNN